MSFLVKLNVLCVNGNLCFTHPGFHCGDKQNVHPSNPHLLTSEQIPKTPMIQEEVLQVSIKSDISSSGKACPKLSIPEGWASVVSQ